MKSHLVLPMAFYFFYISILMIVNFRVRTKAVKSGSLKAGFFKNLDMSFQPPEFVVRAGRHFDNQFQLPPIYMITCLTAITLQVETTLSLALAWGFVFSRIAHTAVHLGSNKILTRLKVFGIGWLIVLLMWAEILWHSALVTAY